MYNVELECGFCSLICFIVPMYNNVAINPAEVNYFTFTRNNNNSTIYPRCMDDQYSYYEETEQESES